MPKMCFLHNDSINELNFGIILHFILYANSIIPVLIPALAIIEYIIW